MKALFTNLKNWIGGLFKDESGTPSSKRFVGIVCGLSLCVVLFTEKNPNSAVVDAVALLAFGCLGLSSVDKFTSSKKEIKEAIAQEPKPVEAAPVVDPAISSTCATCGQEPCIC